MTESGNKGSSDEAVNAAGEEMIGLDDLDAEEDESGEASDGVIKLGDLAAAAEATAGSGVLELKKEEVKAPTVADEDVIDDDGADDLVVPPALAGKGVIALKDLVKAQAAHEPPPPKKASADGDDPAAKKKKSANGDDKPAKKKKSAAGDADKPKKKKKKKKKKKVEAEAGADDSAKPAAKVDKPAPSFAVFDKPAAADTSDDEDLDSTQAEIDSLFGASLKAGKAADEPDEDKKLTNMATSGMLDMRALASAYSGQRDAAKPDGEEAFPTEDIPMPIHDDVSAPVLLPTEPGTTIVEGMPYALVAVLSLLLIVVTALVTTIVVRNRAGAAVAANCPDLRAPGAGKVIPGPATPTPGELVPAAGATPAVKDKPVVKDKPPRDKPVVKNKPPRDKPVVKDKPPRDKPPRDKPVVKDNPPKDKPPADKPPADKPPKKCDEFECAMNPDLPCCQ